MTPKQEWKIRLSSKLKNFVHQRTLSTDLKKQSTEKGENIFKAYTQ